ncbi:hypothetical protein [Amaricoccus solimangrovi]|uniref:hypothetical protein n=1 Tax=Amaricoccus solimangrovi TaxID=2589815 RepID=UPI0015E331F9|nr:hypothetical protein [Amaricoccus solimangrovi]
MAGRILGGLFALLVLSGCGGGFELGGDPLDASSAQAAGDDPQDSNAINDGTGDVVE